MKYIKNLLILIAISSSVLYAQTKQQNSSANTQANNPIANIKAFNTHLYTMRDIEEADGDKIHQLWFRYAQPVSIGKTNWLVRASLPIDTYKDNSANNTKTGIGDFNIFAAYLMDIGNPSISFGVGPLVTLPTGSNSELGTEKYSLGFANVLFNASSKKYQFGYLLTYQHSVAGKSSRKDVNIGAMQPFGMFQLGSGTYLRSVGIWFYDFESDRYSVPIGLGIGQVIKTDSTVFNLFLEPQYSVLNKGAGVAKWQVLVGLNMQFLSTK